MLHADFIVEGIYSVRKALENFKTNQSLSIKKMNAFFINLIKNYCFN